jgi:DnaJ-class molecular chaperone
LLIIGSILLIVGGILTYRDIKSDPYQLLRLFKIQTILWWRLRGPLIARKPYIYYFPEGRYLQQQDVVQTISVSKKNLEEGIRLTVKVKVIQLCPECGGKRNKPLTVQIECSHCQNGRQIHSYASNVIPIPCNHCLGTGWAPIDPCPTCHGTGAIWQKQRIRVQVPPYSKPGTKLRIPALGKIDPMNLRAGDLLIKLRRKIFNLI